MSPSPDVSVVLGVYNAGDRLRATLDSVLAQQGCELEFIVVDDGSTDSTAALLDAAAQADARLRVIHQANAGLTRALMAGCAAARAPFLARQDAADVSLPGRLESELQVLRADDTIAFVSCATEYVEPGGAFLYRNAGTGKALQARDVIDLTQTYGMADGPSHHGSVMFRRDAYERAGGYRAQFYFGQDWDLWFRLAQLGKFAMLPQTLYRATLGIGDISAGNKPQQEQLALLSLQALRLRLQGESDAPALAQAATIRPAPRQGARHKSVAAGSYFIGECLRRNGNAQRAREYFLQALQERPWSAKTWVRLAQTAFASGSPKPSA
jgi:glycosyltransferase involved in cell wall biosynthesis